MAANQCLVVCQLCHLPPYKSWNQSKIVDHLKTDHKIEAEDAERLAGDWLTDASRGRPRYPIEVFRHYFQKKSIEGLAVAMGFTLTSHARELCGVVKENEKQVSRKRKGDPIRTVSGDGVCIVDSTDFEESLDIKEIIINNDDVVFEGSTGNDSTILHPADPLNLSSLKTETTSSSNVELNFVTPPIPASGPGPGPGLDRPTATSTAHSSPAEELRREFRPESRRESPFMRDSQPHPFVPAVDAPPTWEKVVSPWLSSSLGQNSSLSFNAESQGSDPRHADSVSSSRAATASMPYRGLPSSRAMAPVESRQSRHHTTSDPIVPPGWNLSENDAASDAWSKSLILKSQRVPVSQSGKSREAPHYWRLCPHCGIPRYDLRRVTPNCIHCTSSLSADLISYIRFGWRLIPTPLWLWIKSLLRIDPAVLEEMTDILVDFGILGLTGDVVAQLGHKINSSSSPKRMKLDKTRVKRSESFYDLFPERVTNKEQRSYFLCPGCGKVTSRVSSHARSCQSLRELGEETKNVIVGVLDQRRIVIPSSRLLKLMKLTEGKKDLRSAVAAVLCSVGSTVLVDNVISPWEFVLRT